MHLFISLYRLLQRLPQHRSSSQTPRATRLHAFFTDVETGQLLLKCVCVCVNGKERWREAELQTDFRGDRLCRTNTLTLLGCKRCRILVVLRLPSYTTTHFGDLLKYSNTDKALEPLIAHRDFSSEEMYEKRVIKPQTAEPTSS